MNSNEQTGIPFDKVEIRITGSDGQVSVLSADVVKDLQFEYHTVMEDPEDPLRVGALPPRTVAMLYELKFTAHRNPEGIFHTIWQENG